MKNIIRFSLMLGLFFTIGNASYGQTEMEKNFKDKVITTNGSVIVGSITDYDPEHYVIIELKNGNSLRFSAGQVKRVIMHSGKQEEMGLPLRTGKIYNETQLSLLTGESGTGVSFAHNVMYQYNTWFALGLGAGVDNYYTSAGRDIFPIFANAKINLTEGTSAPYIGAKMGYGMAFKKESENIFAAEGGFMANPYFGFRKGSRGLIYNFFCGLKFQKADYRFIFGNETRVEDIFFRRLEIGASVMF